MASQVSQTMDKPGKITSPYGSWKSPISSKVVSENAVALQEVRVDWNTAKADTVYWSELRYSEGGRYVVCSATVGHEGYISWTPEGFNARTRVHEYGGGAVFVYDGAVYFSNYEDQRLYKQTSPTSAPEALTPSKQWRYADGQYHVKNGRIYIVREDHEVIGQNGVKEAVNTVVTIDPKTQEQIVLVSGADFYSCPRVSPDGKRLAWVQWDHPNMPWDSTEVWVADLTEGGSDVVKGSAQKVSGGDDVSVIYPGWTMDNELLYIGDQTEWWNLYHVTKSGDHVNLHPKQAEVGCPHWIFGFNKYSIDPTGSGNILTLFGRDLGLLNLKTKEYKAMQTGFGSHTLINYSGDGQYAYCIADSPTQFPVVLRINLSNTKVEVLRESKTSTLDKGYFSIPTEISWTTAGNKIAYGYFYLPQNKDFQAPEGTLPPLLVKAHGGPTAKTFNGLNLKIQYWTSRGFAVLDVNYRGSTGYGKTYRHALRRNWGICDVEDCCSGAEFLAKEGKVEAKHLCIDGGSAGGYTTLASLAFKDVFKAGASHYGVADIEALATDTHKFESRYMDSLIGPYDEEHKQLYKDRSPINHVNSLNCPMAFFQGDEDKIVPPNQAEMMYNAVKAKKLPTVYVLFKGEQHGFRKSENIQKALDGEFYFFSRIFGFEPADKGIELKIENLD
ncbi:uncharacterized protein LOC135466778 [Liolophura sinensis]|uniref:uncharacterized protein LOC135466778 n=1 Tax=Liolophura sinensis TaxID=3198878 RepID=UPI003158BEB7